MDRINSASSFPINQALRAYAQSPRVNRPGGAPFAKSVQPMRPVAAPTQTTGVAQTTRSAPTDTVGKIAPKQSVLQSSSIGDLVGAKVQAIDLSNDVAQITGPKPIVTSAGTYNMFPQAADRNQAATSISANRAANASLGRSLDLNG